jgi:hypothetical protein
VGIIGPGAIKLHPQRNEPTNSSGSLFSQNTRRLRIAQTSARSQRILQVQFGAIIGSQSHGKTTLSVTSVTLTKLAFGKKRYPQVRRQAQGDGKASYSTANNYHIVVLAVYHQSLSST